MMVLSRSTYGCLESVLCRWEVWKWNVGCSKKTELDGRKNMNGGLTAEIPCEQTVIKGCKVTKRLATTETKLNRRNIY